MIQKFKCSCGKVFEAEVKATTVLFRKITKEQKGWHKLVPKCPAKSPADYFFYWSGMAWFFGTILESKHKVELGDDIDFDLKRDDCYA